MFKSVVFVMLALAFPAFAQVGDVTLRKAWEVRADDEQVYGLIIDAVRGKDGTFYLLDSSLHCVHVLDGEGKYITSFGQEGSEGPGNFSGPKAILFLAPDRIAVVQERALEALVPFRLSRTASGIDALPEEKLPMPDSHHGRFATLGGQGTDGQPVLYGMTHQFIPAERKVINRIFLVSQGQDSATVYFHSNYMPVRQLPFDKLRVLIPAFLYAGITRSRYQVQKPSHLSLRQISNQRSPQD